jgi:hypothetical protein
MSLWLEQKRRRSKRMARLRDRKALLAFDGRHPAGELVAFCSTKAARRDQRVASCKARDTSCGRKPLLSMSKALSPMPKRHSPDTKRLSSVSKRHSSKMKALPSNRGR